MDGANREGERKVLRRRLARAAGKNMLQACKVVGHRWSVDTTKSLRHGLG